MINLLSKIIEKILMAYQYRNIYLFVFLSQNKNILQIYIKLNNSLIIISNVVLNPLVIITTTITANMEIMPLTHLLISQRNHTKTCTTTQTVPTRIETVMAGTPV